MGRNLYALFMRLSQGLMLRKLLRRARTETTYALATGERLGRYTHAPRQAQDGAVWVWVHAVSLGETRAAAVLVSALRTRLPGMRLLLTHGTATGREQGSQLLQPGDVQVWQPWDTRQATRAFIAHFRPDIGLLMETEVWPNLVDACVRSGVPLCLVNARMSERSLRKSLRLGWLSRPAYAGLTAVWAQTEDDAQRLSQLGAPVRAVTGNLKFDAPVDAAKVAQGRQWRAGSIRPVVMFASSREGEEDMLLEVLRQRAAQGLQATVQWLLVPRHPQRFDAVAAMVQTAGLSLSRRSQWQGTPQPADVWLGDSLGEMPLYFGLADVALLGGSFAPLGGQNLIEAAACGCHVLMGPHTFNFAEAASMAVQAGAAEEMPDLAQAVQRALELVAGGCDAGLRQQALAWSQAHRGAAAQTVEAVLQLL
jgi:3-deoxy-D-manno-octulosonic-acid transferase